MDRAHRLGQTRTVNVYRLLMHGTLEEKVMGLQQFKLDMANSVRACVRRWWCVWGGCWSAAREAAAAAAAHSAAHAVP